MSCPDYSAQGWQNILVSLDGPVAILKLNRAKQYANHAVLLCRTADCRAETSVLNRRNTMTVPVAQEFVAAYDLFDRDDRVRVVVLTADHTAPAFCSGVRPYFCPHRQW